MHDLLREIEAAFGCVPRPEHFTPHQHCCECAEHDETLRLRTPATIAREDLSPAWDPMCFATLEGYLYYLPGLARLALGTGSEYFLDQFLFHLSSDRIAALDAAQHRALLALLVHWRDEWLDEVDDSDLDALDLCIQALEGAG